MHDTIQYFLGDYTERGLNKFFDPKRGLIGEKGLIERGAKNIYVFLTNFRTAYLPNQLTNYQLQTHYL